eukprot:TRINITY_DN148_c0_g2_i4.p1 TRINITY_DN148_c0_g2~~TRINITY_DN148_c0_g2_i4.p1  ORF type:complete len:120 (+),score=9.79 TRINITY_DN148_c0_g2_i4:18-377(+)
MGEAVVSTQSTGCPVDPCIYTPCSKRIDKILRDAFEKRLTTLSSIEQDLFDFGKCRDRMRGKHPYITGCADDGYFCHDNQRWGRVIGRLYVTAFTKALILRPVTPWAPNVCGKSAPFRA